MCAHYIDYSNCVTTSRNADNIQVILFHATSLVKALKIGLDFHYYNKPKSLFWTSNYCVSWFPPNKQICTTEPDSRYTHHALTGDRTRKPPARSDSLDRPNCLFGQPGSVVQYICQFDKEYAGHIFCNSPEIFVVIGRISHITKQCQ
jgi:hypothetical protein